MSTIAERAITRAITEASSKIAAEGIEGYQFDILDVDYRTELVTIRAVCLDCGQEDIDTTDMDVADYVAEVAAGHDRACDAKDGAE